VLRDVALRFPDLCQMLSYVRDPSLYCHSMIWTGFSMINHYELGETLSVVLGHTSTLSRFLLTGCHIHIS
jgi:hypothetical protein